MAEIEHGIELRAKENATLYIVAFRATTCNIYIYMISRT